MSKRLIVERDPVTGTDTHAAHGQTTNPSPPPAQLDWPAPEKNGTAEYQYLGAVTTALSDFVRVGGAPAATMDSGSSLDAGETAAGHAGPAGKNPQPAIPAVLKPTLTIEDGVGPGTPSAAAGSSFVSIGGRPALLHGDPLTTCGTKHPPGNSTVRSAGQDFVAAAE